MPKPNRHVLMWPSPKSMGHPYPPNAKHVPYFRTSPCRLLTNRLPLILKTPWCEQGTIPITVRYATAGIFSIGGLGGLKTGGCGFSRTPFVGDCSRDLFFFFSSRVPDSVRNSLLQADVACCQKRPFFAHFREPSTSTEEFALDTIRIPDKIQDQGYPADPGRSSSKTCA